MSTIINRLQIEEGLTGTTGTFNTLFSNFFVGNGSGLTGISGMTGPTGPTGPAGGMTFNHIKLVQSLSDLPAASGGKRTLASGTLYWFDTSTLLLGTDYLEVPTDGNIAMRGNSSLATTLVYSGTGAAIRGTNCSFSFSFLTLSAGKAFDFVNNSNNKYFSAQQCAIANQTAQSTITGYTVQLYHIINWVSNTGCLNITSPSHLFLIDNHFNSSNTGTFVTITPDSSSDMVISRNSIDVPSGATGINVTTTSVGNAILNGNVFTGTGTRFSGVNGNTTGWIINHNANVGIAGIQYVDIEINALSSSLSNSNGTYADTGAVKGFALPIDTYDQYATVMEGKISGLFTSAATLRVGIRNHTTSTNITSLGTAGTGTNVVLSSNFVEITPGQEYTGYYVKGSGATDRKSIKLTLKIY